MEERLFEQEKSMYINSFIEAKSEDIFNLNFSEFSKLNFENFFSPFSMKNSYTEFLQILFSTTDRKEEVSKSTIRKLRGLINIDTVLMLLEDMIRPVLENGKSTEKSFDAKFICKDINHESLFIDFCKYFSCTEDQEIHVWYGLSSFKILRPILPVCIFFSYLQINKSNRVASLINTTNVRMQKMEQGYFESCIRFMNFLFENRKRLNYVLNLHILNRFMAVPDVVFFAQMFSQFAINQNNAITEKFLPDRKMELTYSFQCKDQFRYLLRFTTLRPLICKWNLFTLSPTIDTNLFMDINGFTALNHTLTCVSDELYKYINLQDTDRFNQFFAELCEFSEMLMPINPIDKILPITLARIHADLYDDVRQYYNKN